jgi:hypothetical protein
MRLTNSLTLFLLLLPAVAMPWQHPNVRVMQALLANQDIPELTLPSDQLVAYYSFDSNFWDSVSGTVGTGGGSPSIVSESKRGGGALWLNGSSRVRMDGQGTSFLNGATSYTVSCWARWASDGTYRPIIACRMAAGRNMLGTTDVTQLEWRSVSGTSIANRRWNYTPTAGAGWVHYTMVVSGTGSTMYVNGVSVAGVAGGILSPLTATTWWYVGQDTFGTFYFHGHVDELAIWKKALDASEREQLWKYVGLK